MHVALAEADKAAARGEVPVGAVLLDATGRELARAGNEREQSGDPTAHAEVLAIRAAARALGDRHLVDCTLVVTLEPCVMCAGAITAARIGTVVFGSWDDKAGAGGSRHDLLRDRTLPHRCDVVAGVLAEESAEQLRMFFRDKRANGHD
ncbi:MAG: nucleoside deaminase [Mycetocola sp.]